MLEIELLNHASVLIRWGDHALLTDPWFEDYCFAHGWGLRYDNPAAYERAATATHLWVSHFHGDHFHRPTLLKLAKLRPDLPVLTNPCPHFDDSSALEGIGFHRFVPVAARRRVEIAKDFVLERFPVSGIDNALLLRAGDRTILNYNDCNVPRSALEKLLRHVGEVDILLLNFNHAGKLLGQESAEEVHARHLRGFRSKVESIGPRHVVPFASFHAYRSPYSRGQNDSLIEPEELPAVEPRTLPTRPGDVVRFETGREPQILRGPLVAGMPEELRYPASESIESLQEKAEKSRGRLRSAFFRLVRWVPPLTLWLDDLGTGLLLDLRRGVREWKEGPERAQIRTHSFAVSDWFTREYGSISFQVGAHYSCTVEDRRALERTLLACGLADNYLDPRRMLSDFVRGKAVPFLWHRREEILAVLGQRRFGIESRF